jgi:2-methylcitrate dehydratase PrpD
MLDEILLDGIATHALEFDDTMHPATLHPSCVLVPTVLGLSRANSDISGQELLTAYLIGLEAAARISESVGGPAHYRAGWHATSTVGVLAGSLAAARLLRLSIDETINTLAIAASSASGLRINIGSAVKPLHAGQAARDAAMAALLARAGTQGDPDALGGTYGFLSTFTDDASVMPLIDLGAQGFGTGYLLGLKPYPCCGEVVGAVEACIELSHEVPAYEVRSVTVRTNEAAHRIMSARPPLTSSQARFSLPFCVSAALTDGDLTLGTFERINLPATDRYQISPRIGWETEESQAPNREFGADVSVVTTSGKTYTKRIDTTPGWCERQLDEKQCAEKFVGCATPVLGVDGAVAAHRAVSELASRPVSDLHAALHT